MDVLEGINKPDRINYYDKADWEEDEPSSEIPIELHKKYENLEKVFDEICGYDVKLAENESINDRKYFDYVENLSPNDFVYGEITFRTFSYIINHILYRLKIKIKQGIFYDLGSGSGRAIVAAYLIHEFTKCVGIELLKSLHNMTNKIIENIENLNYNKQSGFSNKNLENIKFLQGNILEYDYDYFNTSLILANCKTFSKDLMKNIAEKLKPMPKGVILITTTQTLEDYDTDWEVVEKLRKLMSWGCANLYIHIKK